MEFKFQNGHEAIRFSIEGVSGIPAIGGYLLRFSVGYRVNPWKESWGPELPTFRAVVARVEVGDAKIRLGMAVPEVQWVVSPTPHVQSRALLFELPLTNQQVEHLERIRLGKALEFVLRFSGERVDRFNHETLYAEVRHRVPQEDWIRVLTDFEYGHFLLCEIPIVLGEHPEFSAAWRALDAAGKRLYVGDYSGAVAQCRIAIEAVPPSQQLQAAIKAAVKKRGEDSATMSKKERLLNLLDAVRHASHLSVHVDGQNGLVEYSRDEALMILGATASAIRDLARRSEETLRDA